MMYWDKRTQLDNVSNGPHDQETNTNGLGDLDELLAVSCMAEDKLAGTP